MKVAVGRQRPPVRGGGGAVALILACTIPLWLPAIPPFTDVPGHIGGYHLELNLHAVPALQAYYSFTWHLIGNLGGELWVAAFGALLGVELAAKLAVIASVALQAAGLLLIAREAHGRPPSTAVVALPFIYCFPLYFGFLNYCLGMGLALLGFGGWLWLERRGLLLARFFLLLLFAPFVWLTHAIAWVLLALMCGGAELWRIWMTGPRSPMTWGSAVLRLLPLLVPVVLMLMAPAGAPHDLAGFLSWRTLPIFIAASLRDRWRGFDLLSLMLPMLLVGCAALGLWRLRMQSMLAVVTLVLLLFVLVMPFSVNGSSWLQQRIIPYVEALAILAISTQGMSTSAERRLRLAALAYFAVRISGVALSCFLYAQNWSSYLEAIDLLPRGARVLALTVVDCERPRWYASRTDHLAGMALARRDAFVNDQWALSGIQLLQVHYPAAGAFTTDPSQEVRLDRCPELSQATQVQALARVPRAAFDYVWLLNTRAADRPFDPGLHLIWSNDRGALYRIVKS